MRVCIILMSFIIQANCAVCEGHLEDATTEEFRTGEATRYIVKPMGHEVVPSQVHESILMVRDALMEYDPAKYTQDIFDRYFRLVDSNTISYVNGSFECDADNWSGHCVGQYTGKIKLTWESCIGETSLVHELLHQYESLMGRKPESEDDHGTPGIFEETAGQDSIETRLKRKQCEMWCSC
jgi:hypothetical protein